MNILDLKVRGYRSLKQVDWTPGALNVVIGPNGSGKSNLLRCLELISIAAKGNLGKHVQSVGGMEPLLWDNALDSISFSLRCSPIESNRVPSRDSLTYELELRRLGKSGAYSIDKELLANYYKVNIGESSQPFKFIERDRTRAIIFDENQRTLVAPEGSLQQDETVLSSAVGPFSANHVISEFRSQLASWCVYHDVHVNRDAAIRQPAVARSETRLDPDGQNLISVLHTLSPRTGLSR